MGLVVSYQKKSDGFYTFTLENEQQIKEKKAYRVKINKFYHPFLPMYNPEMSNAEYEELKSKLTYDKSQPTYFFIDSNDENVKVDFYQLRKLMYFLELSKERVKEIPLNLPEPPTNWYPEIDPCPKEYLFCKKEMMGIKAFTSNNPFVIGGWITFIISWLLVLISISILIIR